VITRQQKTFYSFLVLVVIAAVAAHVFNAGSSSPANAGFRNDLHSPAFAILTAILYRLLQDISPHRRAMAIAVALALATAVFGELAQYIAYGRASAADIVRDSIGIGTGLLLATALGKDTQRSQRIPGWLWKIAAILALMLITFPATISGKALITRQLALPSIMSFDQTWERSFFWSSNGATIVLDSAPADWPSAPGNLALIIPSKSGFSGIEIDPPSDWSRYTHLSLTIASADNRNHKVMIRIDDEAHNSNYRDRFGLSITATPSPVTVRIPISDIRRAPAGRAMEIDSIRSLIISMVESSGDEQLLLDDIRLEAM